MQILLPAIVFTVLVPTPAAQEAVSRFDAAVIAFRSQSAIHSLADLNGDGILDGLGWWRKFSGDAEVDLQAFVGLGDGTFQLLWERTEPSTYQQLADVDWAMEVGRFDVNVRDDFVVAFDALVEAYTSLPSGFATLYWRRDTSDVSIVSSAVVADFDGDGLDDFALAHESDDIQLYINDGAGFSLTSTFPYGQSLVAADVDGVPGLDLVARSGNVIRLLSVTAGTVTSHDSFIVPFSVSQGLHEVAGDIDGDGDDDVVVFAESIEDYVVLRQGDPGVFVMEAVMDGGPASDLADIDGDGDLDGVCCGGGGCPCPSTNDMVSTYRISLNDGTGAFDTGWAIRGHGALRLAGASDVDGDGDVDLVAGRSIYYNRGFGLGEPQPLVSLRQNYWLLTRFGDVDEDGDLDAYDNIYENADLNNGAGSTPSEASPVRPVLPAGASWSNPCYVGDFDGDGDLDQLVEYNEPGTTPRMKLLLNTGGGDYIDGGWAVAPGTTIGGSGFGGALVADLDDDGDQDLVAGTSNSSPAASMEFWFNDGSGQFTLGFTKMGANPLVAVDFDGNGLVDVLEQGLKISFGTGGGAFDIEGDLMTGSFSPYRGIAVGDLDENGFPDIVAERGWDIIVWWNQGSGVFVDEEVQVGSGRHKDAVVGDVDGDGHLDLIVNGVDTRYARILRGDGAGNFTVDVDLALDVLALEDMDGDGDLDALSSGSFLARSTRPATQGGARQQFGKSTAGTAGMTPKLGAAGPFRVGETAEVRLVGGQGASFAVILVSAQVVISPDWPAPGFIGYTAPGAYIRPLVLDGSAAVPGSGSARLSSVLPPSFQGLTLIMQGYVQDTGVVPWLTQTNGLLLHID